jgi:hypothetical protein
MKADTVWRAVRVVFTLAAAMGIAVWVGLSTHSRQTRVPAPAAAPAGGERADRDRRVCAERLAKLGKALRLYAADHGGAFPITETPGESEVRLLPCLKRYGAVSEGFRCPTAETAGGKPYVYHSYRRRDSREWPNWMAEEHIVTRKSPAGTWLMSDYLARDAPGPHSQTEKALNALRADGSVEFHVGRPREVYK